MLPEQLGPYRIVRILGRGGMGAVYQAVHVETDEPAAVKVLSAGLAEDPDFRQRFEAEIETLKRLFHPNIVQLFGFGEQEGHLFYAMELVDGSSLEEELRRGRAFDWREVARIGIDACRALRHAHDRGITHRDIKPANLLLTRDGRIKLSDFGIAKLFGNTRLTATGNVVGTAEYMPPEQADARPTGPRGDLYSTGCVLYCLLARRPPFRARSLVEMLEKHRGTTPDPVSRYASDVPAEMELLIAQLLEKDPDKRPANATVVARRLEAMLRALSVQPNTQERRAVARWEQEFELGPAGGAAASRPGSDLPPTRLADQPSPPSQVPNGVTRAAAPLDQLPETKETAAFQMYDPSAGQDLATGVGGLTERRSAGRFVAVDKEELDRPEPEQPPHAALISPQTWVLAGCLVAVGLGAWYLLQPPSADALYERIISTTADRSIDSLRAARDDIQAFLTRYSNDSRAGKLRHYMREIELHELEREFDRRAKGMSAEKTLIPVERMYLEAMNYVRLDPDRGLAKLQALVDLHQDRTDPSGPEGQCLELARRQLARLKQQAAKWEPDSLAELGDRMARARQLRKTDPEAARSMWQALIEWYQDKPWAAQAVQEARKALEEDIAQRRKATP